MAKERFKLIPAVFLVLRKDGKILLLQRANTGYQDGKYSVVAGHLEGDELATAVIAREAKEEAGITIDPKDLELIHVCHRLSRGEVGQERVDLFFEATKWQGEPTNMEPHKSSDVSWFPLDNLPANMLPMVRYVLEAIQDGSSYTEFLSEPA